MNKEYLSIINYIIAVVNSANKNNYKIYYNLVVFLVDAFDFKKIQHKFIDEKTEGFILIELYYKTLKIELEYNANKNNLYILNITKETKKI